MTEADAARLAADQVDTSRDDAAMEVAKDIRQELMAIVLMGDGELSLPAGHLALMAQHVTRYGKAAALTARRQMREEAASLFDRHSSPPSGPNYGMASEEARASMRNAADCNRRAADVIRALPDEPAEPQKGGEMSDREQALLRAIHAGCNAAYPNFRCAWPKCPCVKVPHAIRAALDALPPDSGAPHLFQDGEFTAHSGQRLPFKIDCDALTDADLATLAADIARRFKFSRVHGIPRGGVRLARALEPYLSAGQSLIVDDVLTTGNSMEEARRNYPDAQGVVIFARGPCPAWITPLFTALPPADSEERR